MKCPNCGVEVTNGSKYICQNCGASLNTTEKCSYCGGEITPTVLKCPHCGEWTAAGEKYQGNQETGKALRKLLGFIVVIILLIALGSALLNGVGTALKDAPPVIPLNAKVSTDGSTFSVVVTNADTETWSNCEFNLNTDYKLKTSDSLAAGDTVRLPMGSFTKDDGTRFDILTTAIKDVFVECDISGSKRYSDYGF